MVSNEVTYDFAFTGASLKFHDFMRLANYMADQDFESEIDLDPTELMRRPNSRTNRREFQEMIKRFRFLTPMQQRVIVDLDPHGQKQLAMIAACKAHPFLRDFIVEVVREKFLSLDYQLTDGDYQSFINRKMDLHPELENFSESTARKARQVTWRFLEQAGLINNTSDRVILPQYISPKVVEVISEDNPSLLKILLMSDREIKALVV